MMPSNSIGIFSILALGIAANPLSAAEPPMVLRSAEWDDGVRVDIVRSPFFPREAASPLFAKTSNNLSVKGGFTIGVTLNSAKGDPVTIGTFFISIRHPDESENLRVVEIATFPQRVVFLLARPPEAIAVCEAGLRPFRVFYLKRSDWSEWTPAALPLSLPPERVSARIEVDPKDESTTVEVIDAYDPQRVGHALFRRGRDDPGYTLVKRWHVPET